MRVRRSLALAGLVYLSVLGLAVAENFWMARSKKAILRLAKAWPDQSIIIDISEWESD